MIGLGQWTWGPWRERKHADSSDGLVHWSTDEGHMITMMKPKGGDDALYRLAFTMADVPVDEVLGIAKRATEIAEHMAWCEDEPG